MTQDTAIKIHTILVAQFGGRENAQPIERIVDAICAAGINTSRRHFQLRVKRALLEMGYVVGACEDGMFLCLEPSDYGIALQWYERRIAAEQRNMGLIIQTLVNQAQNAS